ncbi:MAG: hypothetical protein AAF531_26980 [Actinomycetota bacterium]
MSAGQVTPSARLRRWVRDAWQELRARRAGRRGLSTGIARATRDVTGPTGWVFSNAWQQLDEHGDAYMKSFDRRIPPSIFISERDRTRHGQPIPVAERCLEDARLSPDVGDDAGGDNPRRSGRRADDQHVPGRRIGRQWKAGNPPLADG